MTTSEKERLSVVETKIDSISKDIAEIKEILKDSDSRFAAKWVEKVISGLVGTILTGVLLALLSLVIINGG